MNRNDEALKKVRDYLNRAMDVVDIKEGTTIKNPVELSNIIEIAKMLQIEDMKF